MSNISAETFHITLARGFT